MGLPTADNKQILRLKNRSYNLYLATPDKPFTNVKGAKYAQH